MNQLKIFKRSIILICVTFFGHMACSQNTITIILQVKTEAITQGNVDDNVIIKGDSWENPESKEWTTDVDNTDLIEWKGEANDANLGHVIVIKKIKPVRDNHDDYERILKNRLWVIRNHKDHGTVRDNLKENKRQSYHVKFEVRDADNNKLGTYWYDPKLRVKHG